MSVIHAPAEKQITFRLLVVPIVLGIAFVAFLLRLWYWQIVKAEDYQEQAVQAGRLIDTSMAPRGKIFDRKGVLLADVQAKFVVTAEPQIVEADPEILEKVAEILQTSVKKLKRSLGQNKRGNLPTPIFVGATIQKATIISEAGEDLPGIAVETQPMRTYTDNVNLTHVLGWVGVLTKELEDQLVEDGLTPADYVGRDGIEKFYEEELMGEAWARTIAIDRARRPVRMLYADQPVPGQELILSLDLELQRKAMEMLEASGKKGAIVAIDPRNGEVLCMASFPTYDNSMYEDGLTEAENQFLNFNDDRPLYKRAIAGLYPPGSTFKIVTAYAGYLGGDLSYTNSVYCPRYLLVGRRRVMCENHPAGSYNFNGAFTKSCNTFFGGLAQKAGLENMQRAAEAFGLGTPGGIDIPGERRGLVPNEEHVRKVHKRPWSGGDTNNFGIGQGDLLVTPLQMANVAAAVANGGVIYKPHVVKGILPHGSEAKLRTVEKEVLHRIDASSDFWVKMQGAMVNVVKAGTARRSALPDIQLAGKTGSAEHRRGEKTHAWFVGYAPAENPQIAFAIVVEAAGHGGEIAAPMAKEIVRVHLGPEEEEVEPENDSELVAVGD